MKTLSELAKDVYNARSLPGELAELHIQLAAQYSTMNDQMMEVQLKKADYWRNKDYEVKPGRREDYRGLNEKNEAITETVSAEVLEKRDKPLSDTAVEMMWLQTEDGRKEIKLKYALRSLEKLMSAVKSSLVNATIEARNI